MSLFKPAASSFFNDAIYLVLTRQRSPFALCSLFTVPIRPAQDSRQDIVGASLDISFYHANCSRESAMQISRYGGMLFAVRQIKGRPRRLQILPISHAVSLLSLTLITFFNHSFLLVLSLSLLTQTVFTLVVSTYLRHSLHS